MKIRCFLFAAALSLLAACSKDPGDSPATPAANPGEISVTLPSSGPLAPYSWAADDAVRVGSTVFALQSGAGEKQGVFKGEDLTGSYFNISYPSSVAGIASFNAFSFDGQEQDGNGSAAHLKNVVLIENAGSYKDITLSKEWATAQGGSFRSNGVLAFDLTLPYDVGVVSEIILSSPGIQFPMDNAGTTTAENLTLSLKNVIGGHDAVKAYLAIPAQKVEIGAETGLVITIDADQAYTCTLNKAISFNAGELTEIKVADAAAWTATTIVRGDGTEASPYILMTAEDLVEMRNLIVAEQFTWFKLGADIDMSGITDWDPLTVAAPYPGIHLDGDNHTISHFSCADKKYASFFGVLNGSCKNLIFNEATCVSEMTGSSMGIVAGYCGSTDGAAQATVENVKVTNSLVTSTFDTAASVFPLGGLFGSICYSTIKGCNFSGKVINGAYASQAASNPDRCATGGIAGKTNASVSIESCSTNGEITSTKARYTGGIVGWVSPSEDTNISSCVNMAAITGGVDRTGGIVGHYQQGTIKDCLNLGDVSCGKSGSISGAGGIVGYSGAAVISHCGNMGSVSGSGRCVGGIIGYAEGVSTIEKCVSQAEVTGGSRYVGGIAGGMKVAGSSISNCGSAGSVTCTGDQEAGGIVGSVMTGQSVTYCASVATVQATRVAGGIVGRACNDKWVVDTNLNNTVSKCIAWNPSVTATNKISAAEGGGSGCVVGFTSFKNTLSDCYRNPNMVFEPSDPELNPAVDQPNCSPDNPFVLGTTPGTAATYACPYHGVAAQATDTVSSLAKALGWDETIWDLSSDVPALR